MTTEDKNSIAKAVVSAGHSLMVGGFAIAATNTDGLFSILLTLYVIMYIAYQFFNLVFQKTGKVL